MPRRQRLSVTDARLPALLAGALLVAGCSGAVTVEGGADGSSQACRDVLALLPATLAGAPSRATTGEPGTAAWGDPAIVLACGTEPIGPTTLECVTVDDRVDWVVLAGGTDGAILTTYGRDPAVTVEVPGQYGPAPFVLTELGDAVQAVPATASCV